jgi:3-methyl-2-oxobutanoate hydroxymethyltransferase
MSAAGVPLLLVGDSAANVVLGHETTLPVPLGVMIELTAAVRRGAPLALVVADMPFGSYQASIARGTANTLRMMKRSGCDMVKLEVSAGHAEMVRRLADAGVAVMAHFGLRPQAVGLLGGYRSQGRSAEEAGQIVALARQMEQAGAAALLLEAVPAEVSEAVVEATDLPVVGCGAGPACHAHVVVTHDALGLTEHRPRFVPLVGDLGQALRAALGRYVEQTERGQYPAPEHQYTMLPEEKSKFLGRIRG